MQNPTDLGPAEQNLDNRTGVLPELTAPRNQMVVPTAQKGQPVAQTKHPDQTEQKEDPHTRPMELRNAMVEVVVDTEKTS